MQDKRGSKSRFLNARWTVSRRGRGERGFSLMLIAVCVIVLFGMFGLAYDLGRIFILKSELQTFADQAALAAATQLDGTKSGVELANTTATKGPLGTTKANAYNFDTTDVDNVVNTFATTFSGTYDSYATADMGTTNNYRFIKVVATENAPITFFPVIHGMPSSFSVSAVAIAGAYAQSSATNGGLEPFLPDAHNPADTTNFGFTPGVEYTLKWANGSTSCAGDSGFNDPNNASQHGFVDLGQGNGNSSLRSVITYGGYPNANSTPSSVGVGTYLSSVPGNRGSSIFSTLNERATQDTDDTSTSWAQYKTSGTGNGRRIITVPIGNPSTISGHGSNTSEEVIGFGNFLLDTGYSGSSGAICATYIGPGNLSSYSTGASDGTKLYTNYLYQ